MKITDNVGLLLDAIERYRSQKGQSPLRLEISRHLERALDTDLYTGRFLRSNERGEWSLAGVPIYFVACDTPRLILVDGTAEEI
ncbi:hypothetical protein C9I56_11105 [Paraburkholderia caribensis]|uniref:hypothetical protein n=1 Tax=Paraburkholderia caribensis TaxID=75105 RepID=UPI000D16CFE1|nr:hypothetical protein [Paraburkholderia caribensis]PTB28831.1 hypothetical protein C9I56_11105 [Paraburkholderia caribensis]